MLLGFIISECGIEANSKKILPISRMGPFQNIKGYNHFISRLGERGLPLY